MILKKLTGTGPEGNIPFAMVNNTVIFNTENETPYKLFRISGVPTSPVLLLPPNNDKIPSINIEFKWEIPSNSNFYQLQISSDSIFSSIVFASDSIYTSSYEVKGLTNHKDYYWRVRAYNSIGESKWSTVYAFKTDADTYPKAVRFLSDGDYIDVPHSSSLIPEHMTIEFWLRVLEVGEPSVGGGQTIIDKRGGGGGYNINLYGESFPLGILITFEPNGYTLGPGNVIESQKWYHIAVTWDQNMTKFYLNGVLVNTVFETYISKSTMPLRVGEYIGYPGGLKIGLRGDIDELRFWNYARSESEIKSSMYQILTGQEMGLMLYWNFDNDYGSTVKDQTSNGNDGAISGNVQLIVSDALVSIVKEDMDIPQTFELYQNYPNPFNLVTNIRFQLPKHNKVSIKVFDTLGRAVKTLVDKDLDAGLYFIEFDGTDNSRRKIASGIYFYYMETKDFAETKKFLLLK